MTDADVVVSHIAFCNQRYTNAHIKLRTTTTTITKTYTSCLSKTKVEYNTIQYNLKWTNQWHFTRSTVSYGIRKEVENGLVLSDRKDCDNIPSDGRLFQILATEKGMLSCWLWKVVSYLQPVPTSMMNTIHF